MVLKEKTHRTFVNGLHQIITHTINDAPKEIYSPIVTSILTATTPYPLLYEEATQTLIKHYQCLLLHRTTKRY